MKVDNIFKSKIYLLLFILFLDIGVMAKNNISISKSHTQKAKKVKFMEQQRKIARLYEQERHENYVRSPLLQRNYRRESGNIYKNGLSNAGLQFCKGFIVKLLSNSMPSFNLDSSGKGKFDKIFNSDCIDPFVGIYNHIVRSGDAKKNISENNFDWIKKAAALIKEAYVCLNKVVEVGQDFAMGILKEIVSIATRIFVGILTFGISEIVRTTVKIGEIAICTVRLYNELTNGKWNYYEIGNYSGCIALKVKELIDNRRKRKHKRLFRTLHSN